MKIIKRFITWEDSLLGTYTEQESGKNPNRPELAKALAQCQKEGATLIIAKLDRLARNLSFLMRVIDTPGVEVKFCDMPQANRMMIQIIGAIAEYEAKIISERTKIGVRAAMAAGKIVGTPGHKIGGCPITDEDRQRSVKTRKTRAKRLNKPAYAYAKNLRGQGLSYREISLSLNDNGFLSSKGNPWSEGTVRKMFILYQS
jgi:DNA invertase Pin-like site-specific DNA recombinase